MSDDCSGGGHLTPGLMIAFVIASRTAPRPGDVLAYGRVLAERGGLTVDDDAQPIITPGADYTGVYRIEVPAHYA
jgi:hypothetical protein